MSQDVYATLNKVLQDRKRAELMPKPVAWLIVVLGFSGVIFQRGAGFLALVFTATALFGWTGWNTVGVLLGVVILASVARYTTAPFSRPAIMKAGLKNLLK